MPFTKLKTNIFYVKHLMMPHYSMAMSQMVPNYAIPLLINIDLFLRHAS